MTDRKRPPRRCFVRIHKLVFLWMAVYLVGAQGNEYEDPPNEYEDPQPNEYQDHPKFRRRQLGLKTKVVKDEYIIVLRKNVFSTESSMQIGKKLLAGFKDDNTFVKQGYSKAIRGFSAKLSKLALAAVLNSRLVKFVEENTYFEISFDMQFNPPWGLDRIDQASLPLDAIFQYDVAGDGVDVYIMDTGLLTTHEQFGGRASCAKDTVTSGGTCPDQNGHGTHVAGTIGSTSYGVAKNVNLKSIKVCDSGGYCTLDRMTKGLDYVAGRTGKRVINVSISGAASATFDDAANGAAATGAVIVMAAGNFNDIACTYLARSTSVLSVGAIDKTDTRASYSNYGSCVDIFAPGSSITSCGTASNTAVKTMDGTSMACPHVSGAAALLLQIGCPPSDVFAYLRGNATSGTLKGIRTGSPNLLLRINRMATGAPSSIPSYYPSEEPSNKPSNSPTVTAQPSPSPSMSQHPSAMPSELPSMHPSSPPSTQPSTQPSEHPSLQPSTQPSEHPSSQPSEPPSAAPSPAPSHPPSQVPSLIPSEPPSSLPSYAPSSVPSLIPTEASFEPSVMPSAVPVSPVEVQTPPTKTCPAKRIHRLCRTSKVCCAGYTCKIKKNKAILGRCQLKVK